MAMHDSVMDVFNRIGPTGVNLTNTDVNRIVTNVVRNFDLESPAVVQIEKELESYVARYKRVTKRDCGCNKKK